MSTNTVRRFSEVMHRGRLSGSRHPELHDPRQENGLRVQEKYRALSIAEIVMSA